MCSKITNKKYQQGCYFNVNTVVPDDPSHYNCQSYNKSWKFTLYIAYVVVILYFLNFWCYSVSSYCNYAEVYITFCTGDKISRLEVELWEVTEWVIQNKCRQSVQVLCFFASHCINMKRIKTCEMRRNCERAEILFLFSWRRAWSRREEYCAIW